MGGPPEEPPGPAPPVPPPAAPPVPLAKAAEASRTEKARMATTAARRARMGFSFSDGKRQALARRRQLAAAHRRVARPAHPSRPHSRNERRQLPAHGQQEGASPNRFGVINARKD